MAAAKAVWRSSCGGGDRREPAWILGFRRKRTNLHEKYGYPNVQAFHSFNGIEQQVVDDLSAYVNQGK